MALARTPGEGLVCEFGDHRSVDHRTAHGGNCAVDTCPRSAWQWRWHCTAVTSRGALVHRPQYLRERLYRFRRERPCRSIAVALPENSKVGNGSRLCENAKFRYRVLAASAFGQPIRPRWVDCLRPGSPVCSRCRFCGGLPLRTTGQERILPLGLQIKAKADVAHRSGGTHALMWERSPTPRRDRPAE